MNNTRKLFWGYGIAAVVTLGFQILWRILVQHDTSAMAMVKAVVWAVIWPLSWIVFLKGLFF
jgi:hypothetical protein